MSRKLELVPVSTSYADVMLGWRKQPSTVRHNPVMDLNLDQLKEAIKKEKGDLVDLKDKTSYRWMALRDETPVGNVSLSNVNLMMNYAEIGYGVGESYQGQGLGYEMVKSLVDMVFEKTDLRKLIAHVHEDNIPSCKILDKLGFKREGLLREHYIINGKPENEILFGLLRHEYEKNS